MFEQISPEQAFPPKRYMTSFGRFVVTMAKTVEAFLNAYQGQLVAVAENEKPHRVQNEGRDRKASSFAIEKTAARMEEGVEISLGLCYNGSIKKKG